MQHKNDLLAEEFSKAIRNEAPAKVLEEFELNSQDELVEELNQELTVEKELRAQNKEASKREERRNLEELEDERIEKCGQRYRGSTYARNQRLAFWEGNDTSNERRGSKYPLRR